MRTVRWLVGLATVVAAVGVAAVAPVAAAPPGADVTERIAARDPAAVAVEVSQRRFAAHDRSGRHARHVVLSRDDTFADSLAGSALTADGPLLFTRPDRLVDVTAAELDRVLGGSGTVHLLGGTKALSVEVERALRSRGYTTERHAGPSRVETALAVAEAVRRTNPTRTVILARATEGQTVGSGWADSISSGAFAARTRTPVLLTPTDGLHPRVRDWLRSQGISRTILVGGRAALSDAVAADAPGAERVSGPNRAATAAAIARQLWQMEPSGNRAATIVDGERADGWSFGLAAAGLAADRRAPVLLVDQRVPDATRTLVSTCGAPQVATTVVGDGSVVDGAVRERLDDLDGKACGPGGALVQHARLSAYAGCPDLLDHLREVGRERVGPHGFEGPVFIGVPEPLPAEEDSGAGGEAPAAPTVGDARDEGFSGTNVQEEGVDEPDLVKTDGSIAAIVGRGGLQLVDVTGTTPRLLSSVELPDGGHELLLRDDRVLVMTTTWPYLVADGPAVAEEPGIAPDEPAPQPREEPSEPGTHPAPDGAGAHTLLTVLDIADPSAPVVEHVVELEGTYRSARMIDGTVRVVLVSDPHGFDFVWPNDGSEESLRQALEHNLAAVDAAPLDAWLPGYRVLTADGQERSSGDVLACDDVLVPADHSGMQTLSVVTLDLDAGAEPTSSAGVLASGETVYASTSRLLVTTGRWGPAFQPQDDSVRTEVHAFDITDPASTRYVAAGAVEGWVLNQFSLSEHEGDIRIATTIDAPWSEPERSRNAVTVLREQGDELVEVGRVDGLGEGERIQAVRFMGELAAVVTFRRIDPLYLLDLTDGTAPRVLGELKVPGYSAYLHRIDDTHLLGVGQDADEATGITTGTQVALYDISDLTAPRQLSRVTYENGSSEVEYDHRAFLWWSPTGDAVLPLYQWSEQRQEPFAGAVVVEVDAAGGSVTKDAAISHTVTVEGDGESYTYDVGIRRSFVVGDTLFTVADEGVGSSRLSDHEVTAFVEFPEPAR